MTESPQVIFGKELEFATPDTPYNRLIREVLSLEHLPGFPNFRVPLVVPDRCPWKGLNTHGLGTTSATRSSALNRPYPPNRD